MTTDLLLRTAIDPALSLLPHQMDTAEARAMLLAIALQETHLLARRQKGGGPARSYWQFERSGISGVLSHAASSLKAMVLCDTLDVLPNVDQVYAAIEYQDILAAGFARLLLWRVPRALVGPSDPEQAWTIYMDTWEPGTPRHETWTSNFAVAWGAVLQGRQFPLTQKA